MATLSYYSIMDFLPVTDGCSKNLHKRIHVCFGISPFNSYFSEQRIQDLAAWGRREFESMHFFVPDIPSAYTLEALGYDSEKAIWKARRQSQYLQNKIHRALKNLGYTDLESWNKVLNWNILTENGQFIELYQETLKHFETDEKFRSSCLEASRWVLERRVPDTSTLSPEVLKSAVRYLLAEIPLFIDSAGILEQEASVFCYHQCIPFIEGLFRGCFSLRARKGQGFVILKGTPANPTLDQKTPQGVHYLCKDQ